MHDSIYCEIRRSVIADPREPDTISTVFKIQTFTIQLFNRYSNYFKLEGLFLFFSNSSNFQFQKKKKKRQDHFIHICIMMPRNINNNKCHRGNCNLPFASIMKILNVSKVAVSYISSLSPLPTNNKIIKYFSSSRSRCRETSTTNTTAATVIYPLRQL